jgi:putative FmdB family regulatory protein
MPTYEYRCTACENEWEELQKISEPPVEVCPKCSQKTAKRQISGGNFILKGGGWYADLYSSKSNKTANGEAGKSEKSEGGKTEGGEKRDEKKDEKKEAKAEKAETKAEPAKAPSTTKPEK